MEGVKNMGREKYAEHLKYKYLGMEDTVTESTRITAVGGEKKDHLYTWERIYHFSCGNCKNWWSYATEEEREIQIYNRKSRKMTCPHCGHYTKIQPNPKFMEKS